MSIADQTTLATDRSGLLPSGPPLEVVVARDVGHVQETLRRASRDGIPIVTRGAASGLAGAAVATGGEIVLDLSGLDRILSIDPVDGVARVEPGVITAELDRAARELGLFYAPDPGSVGISTIGGNIATNAGGLRGAKYGVTRDAVLALDVVLADGELVHVGRSTVKGVTGYDLAGLIVGSEGTLGVVVGATLRLLPIPPHTATAIAYFDSLESAADAVAGIAVSGTRPSVLEIIDGATLQAIDDAQGSTLHDRGEALLVVQTDGFGAEAELAVVLAVLNASAASVEWTTDAGEAEHLLAARRLALPAIERLGRVLIEDIAVPRSRLAEAIREIGVIAERTGVRIFVFGHAGDGNLHPIILIGGDAAQQIPEAARTAADAIFGLALRLGGTLTAEHGIGLLKREWVRAEVGDRVLALHGELKRVLDPAGILNPGKAF
ncbi:FAD-binding oxidoreductase [Rathayibacter sp. KR2-224]|uniref:FAD-binding oxidoreductase n=1 Tax=Rathayibacter sp. KR2-224 TaxID=3400913 RepID=UPI003C114D1F